MTANQKSPCTTAKIGCSRAFGVLSIRRVYIGGEFYEFYPETECVAKWLLATEELHRMHGGEWKNFPWADTYA